MLFPVGGLCTLGCRDILLGMILSELLTVPCGFHCTEPVFYVFWAGVSDGHTPEVSSPVPLVCSGSGI